MMGFGGGGGGGFNIAMHREMWRVGDDSSGRKPSMEIYRRLLKYAAP